MTPYDELRQLAERWLDLADVHQFNCKRTYEDCALELRNALAELERADACSKPLPVLRPITTTLLRVSTPEPLHTPGDSVRDWAEDLCDDNGPYLSQCSRCAHYFYGHKRRYLCKVCFVEVDSPPHRRGASTNNNAR